MGNLIHDLYINIKRGFFTGYLKLCTPTLFIEESSSSTSSEILATMKAFPSMSCFRCIYCSGMTTMFRRVAYALMLSN
jgi:hypothetical protein